MSGYALAAAGLIGLGLTAYLLFGGADFGAGLWHLVSRQERHRRVIEHAMGPIWEANHVWLIFTMVLTWTAFPPAFAQVMSEYWVPLSAAVLCIVCRGAAFAFHKAIPGNRAHVVVFGFASVATPFFFGTVAGSLATDASWWSWTGAFTGLLAVALCGYLAAVYLSWDARRLAGHAVADHFRLLGLGAGVTTGGIALLGTLVLPGTLGPPEALVVPGPLGVAVPSPYVLASALAGLASLALLVARHYLIVRITAALAVATVLWGAAAGVADRLGLAEAAALDQVLVTIFAVLSVGGLVLAPCLVWLYTLFQRGEPHQAIRDDPAASLVESIPFGHDTSMAQADRVTQPSAAKRGRALTLTDIAKLAGVSRSTASRALDQRSPARTESAERVRTVAAEHGYVPNAWAANLRRQRSGVIGVVVPRLTDTVMAMLYEAIAHACGDRALQASVLTTGDDPRVELTRGRALVAQRVDGMILTTARTDGADPLLHELRESDVAYSLALRNDGNGPAAVCDDEAGGHAATQHLIEHGHRRIAFVGGPVYASSSQGREAGFRRAMAEADMEVSPELVHDSNFSMDAGEEIGLKLLALADRPTAVFTANDSLAVGLMASIQRAGLQVPQDVSIVGYNDTPIAARMPTPLTSVVVPFEAVARNAVDLLLDPSARESGEVRVSAPQLVPRDSVGMLR